MDEIVERLRKLQVRREATEIRQNKVMKIRKV
jgi:hypothetical protein